MATFTNTIAVTGRFTSSNPIPVTGLVLRTPKAANIVAAAIHGSAATYPTAFTPVSANATLPPPTVAPTTSVITATSLPAGTYWVSYAWAFTTSGVSVTTPSPPTSVTVTASQTPQASVPVGTTVPPGTGAVAWYIGTAATRLLYSISSTIAATVTFNALGDPTSPEATVNLAVPSPLVFGKSDDESGNYPVPIPQAAPTTTYSWYKSVQLAVPQYGTGNTFISNIAIARNQGVTPGLEVFYRIVQVYSRCIGLTGLPVDVVNNPTGRYPPSDLTPHTGSAPNIPAGYSKLPLTPLVVAPASIWTGNAGAIGPVIQLVCGVADRKAMLLPQGQATMPTLTVYYDES